MPIYMDRHEMEGLTAKDVAHAHEMDIEVQEKYGVKILTYWYDQDRGTGFCLIDAPDKETAARLHRDTHGNVPLDVIDVDLSAVEGVPGPDFRSAVAQTGSSAGDRFRLSGGNVH